MTGTDRANFLRRRFANASAVLLLLPALWILKTRERQSMGGDDLFIVLLPDRNASHSCLYKFSILNIYVEDKLVIILNIYYKIL